jgi:nicotinamide-nucleotide amidase
MQQEIYNLASELGNGLAQRGWKLAVAESCTGGGICYALTEVPGSSVWLDRGFVTYSNQAKQDMLGVSSQTLQKYGAVSSEVVCQMVTGILLHSHVNLAVAVTGIAGPGGATPEKPVGTVFIGWQIHNQLPEWRRLEFSGSRSDVRLQTIQQALIGCLEKLA